MTIIETIEKVKEGGYQLSFFEGEAIQHYKGTLYPAIICKEFLDPLFWRSLGVALGWHKGVEKKYIPYNQWWILPWHRFIDHLAAKKTVESFFETIQ